MKMILVADDDPDLRAVIVASLSDADHAILTASDGHEAIRTLADRHIDLLIAAGPRGLRRFSRPTVVDERMPSSGSCLEVMIDLSRSRPRVASESIIVGSRALWLS